MFVSEATIEKLVDEFFFYNSFGVKINMCYTISVNFKFIESLSFVALLFVDSWSLSLIYSTHFIFLHNECLDILAINETQLHETISDDVIRIEGYDTVGRDGPLNGRNEGGVCFYVCTSINYIGRKDASKIYPSKFPNQGLNHLLSAHGIGVPTLLLSSSEIFELNYNMLPTSCSNINTETLLNITDVYYLKQLICEPTRPRGI